MNASADLGPGARAGDARAKKIVRKRAEIVADIIVDLSLILNPSLILLGGEVGGHPALIEFVRQQLHGKRICSAENRLGYARQPRRALGCDFSRSGGDSFRAASGAADVVPIARCG